MPSGATSSDNVMMYWLPAAGASSARLYWESLAEAAADFAPIAVPAGYAVFPKEVFRLSRRWAETRFTDLRYFNGLERGGHFAALEQPRRIVARSGAPSERCADEVAPSDGVRSCAAWPSSKSQSVAQ
jgi:hypothetical protein